MPADANIYANLLRQPKSVQDYDALAMESQSNMLALDEQRMKAKALKQAQADELAYKNAVKGFGGDVEANYRNLLSAGLPKHAADYQKAALEGREKQAKIDKEAGESLDAGIKRYRDQLSYIESPEAAARWYQAQYADPVVGKFLSGHGTIDQALKEIPSDPAAFKMWRDQIGMGLDAFNKKLQEDTKIAETGRHNKATEGIQERNNIRSNARMTQNGAGAAAPASAATAATGKPTPTAGGATASQDALAKQFGKAPAGYRWKADGSMEFIPGGPADQKAQQQKSGEGTVGSVVADLRAKYQLLDDENAIVSENNKWGTNIGARIGSSGVGQMFGGAVGTKAQSARDAIAMTRPLLLQSIMKATGMSAKQMDSNAELKMYLATATDPTLGLQANMEALDRIEALYGGGVQQPPANKAAPKPASSAGQPAPKAKPSVSNW